MPARTPVPAHPQRPRIVTDKGFLYRTKSWRDQVLIGFVDAESELGAALAERIRGEIARISAKEVARWRAALGCRPNNARVEKWVRAELLNGRKAIKIHPRVNRVLRHLRQMLGRGEDFSLKTLGRQWIRALSALD